MWFKKTDKQNEPCLSGWRFSVFMTLCTSTWDINTIALYQFSPTNFTPFLEKMVCGIPNFWSIFLTAPSSRVGLRLQLENEEHRNTHGYAVLNVICSYISKTGKGSGWSSTNDGTLFNVEKRGECLRNFLSQRLVLKTLG